MKHVVCEISGAKVYAYRDGVKVAEVYAHKGTPILSLCYPIEQNPRLELHWGQVNLTFDDIDIIQDNWNQLQEMRKQVLTPLGTGV